MTAARVIALLTAGAFVLSAGIGSAPAASASPGLPVLYNYAEGFQHGRVEPHDIFVGNGSGAPYVLRLRWPRWIQASARGRGVLDEQIPGCTLTPGYRCPHYRHPVRVYLHRVRSHNGVRYFTRMRWTSHGETIYWRSHQGYWDTSGRAAASSARRATDAMGHKSSTSPRPSTGTSSCPPSAAEPKS
jgi:hypothetical protein